MNSVREEYEALILREDSVVQGIQTCERALSLLVDELVYRESESSCLETAEAICEAIRQKEEELRKQWHRIRWEKARLASQFPDRQAKAEVR
ncbi:hypothetical protein M4D70_23165 [Brevibacillus borstelensis]|uniref:hypothetical protein n=1 Tax=Brevibacillus borstelensis TaxID=45462 RepID=UPI00203ABF90|nr:hypothetical protein [Brevibacillus borstelensis]MCM3625127.1 hypothetical protein [Brevibacillus borstelensis]MED1873047.1 hypothetical protein [Brevibacillus borstelensis]